MTMASTTVPFRALSCNGVSFETSRIALVHPASSAEPEGQPYTGARGRWVWMPWGRGMSIRNLTGLNYIERSMSSASSHYCDVEEEEGDIEEQKIQQVEEKQQEEQGGSTSKKPAPESRLSVILLDQGLFTVYKQLFALVFTLNITALSLAIAGYFSYGKTRPALFSIANILALTLCRSEASLRIVFWLAVKVFGWSWVPLKIKLITTSLLQSLGGIHSSCGVSSVAWLIYALVLSLKGTPSIKVVAVASTILSLLSLCCLAAFPLVRHLHHNVFERTHRFAGWMALGLLWAFLVLNTDSNANLMKLPEIWLTAAITIFTVLPWVTVRRVPVSVTAPSGHASIIKFPGGIRAGILGRISRSPLSEWHAFGIISDGKDNHTMLAGAVGDFTRGLVSNPPNHLWVRGIRFAGLPYLVNMYDRVVLVATGSGICVFLSFLMQSCAADVCVVWVAKEVEKNFGTEIVETLRRHPKEKVIVHDTAVSGRPNVAELTIQAVRKWKAEVVVVTSNPRGSKDVVDACKSAKIPAFGPIWDS